MQYDSNENSSFDLHEEDPDQGSRLALWIWPVMGSIAIGVIVVTMMQTPWLQAKLGLSVTTQTPATKTVTVSGPKKNDLNKQKADNKPAEMAAKVKFEKTAPIQPATKAIINDIASLRIEITRIGDTLATINKSIKQQNDRIAKLEKVVGAVTGSISGAKREGGSSTRTKSVKTKAKTTVNSSAKTDLPANRKNRKGGKGEKGRKTQKDSHAAMPVRTVIVELHQDTGDARTSTPVEKPVTRPAKSGVSEHNEQFALILARARGKSILGTVWEKLIRGKAGELSVLEPRIREKITDKGEKVFDLLAGPFSHIADAIELCARLKLENIKCKQTTYGGKPL